MYRRKNVKQSEKVNRKLAAYTAGAGAALVATGQADAGIISETGLDQSFSVNNPVMLNMEGNNDEAAFVGTSGSNTGMLGRRFSDSFSVNHSGGLLEKLTTTASVGSAVNTPTYSGGWLYIITATTNYFGAWDEDGDTGYFGFSFTLENESASGLAAEGETVYGWAEMERVTATEGNLLGWAYEDSGDPIQVGAVPEPNTLAMLALGAAGVAAAHRRRRRTE